MLLSRAHKRMTQDRREAVNNGEIHDRAGENKVERMINIITTKILVHKLYIFVNVFNVQREIIMAKKCIASTNKAT